VGAARLVLIEGMIGAGKTTTARRVQTWLTSRGEDARAFDELAPDHPIRTRAADRVRAAELYGRYSFPKLMVADPEQDWAAALARIYAAVRP
jgi:thymidylate kinase